MVAAIIGPNILGLGMLAAALGGLKGASTGIDLWAAQLHIL
jgi:hypothetical protein